MLTRRRFLQGMGSLALGAYLLGAGVCCGEEEIPAPPARNDYRMAMVILKTDYNACNRQFEGTLETAQALAVEFPKRFAAATKGRVTVDIDPEIYQMLWSGEPIERWAQMEIAVSQFNDRYNLEDEYDFVTIVSGFQQEKGGFHTNIFNTSDRTDNSPYPEYSLAINSKRIIGVTSLGTIYDTVDACGDYPELLDLESNIMHLFHELGHQWGASIKGIGGEYTYPLEEGMDEAELFNWGHYTSRLADLVDVLKYGVYAPPFPCESGTWWEPLGDGDYKFHFTEQNSTLLDKLEKEQPYSDLTLYAMNALNLDELRSSYLYIYKDFAKDLSLPANGDIFKGRIVASRDIVLGL